MFSAEPESPSLVEKAITTGRPFRRWALAAMVTALSVIPWASFESVLPVHGAISSAYVQTRWPSRRSSSARQASRRSPPTIAEAEPLGPKEQLDALLIAPCTGNTLSKLAHGITDSAVTMAAKAHLRNGRPVVIAFSTNDGLSGSAENIGRLLNRKHYYFVPFGQDDPEKKPRSLQADFSLLGEAVEAALSGRQLQPLLREF